tara:strand:- start:550 stop:1044 length:495 start_codon:yes stop_codon:yes gene_type:complete
MENNIEEPTLMESLDALPTDDLVLFLKGIRAELESILVRKNIADHILTQRMERVGAERQVVMDGNGTVIVDLEYQYEYDSKLLAIFKEEPFVSMYSRMLDDGTFTPQHKAYKVVPDKWDARKLAKYAKEGKKIASIISDARKKKEGTSPKLKMKIEYKNKMENL